jgi:hypothetical protein
VQRYIYSCRSSLLKPLVISLEEHPWLCNLIHMCTLLGACDAFISNLTVPFFS